MTEQEKEQKIKEFHVIRRLLYMIYKPYLLDFVKDDNNNDLDLEGTDITSLPEGLYVPGDLSLWSCRNLINLPKGLHVGRNLDLRFCTSLKSLSRGLHVDGYSDLQDCISLTSLPEDLYVGCNLYLGRCTFLPKKLVLKNVKGKIIR